MSLDSVGRGALDGGWWPRSRNLAVEARDLVDQFPAWCGEIYRVVYSAPDWDPVTRRRFKASRVFVNLGSFPGDDTHLVLVKSLSSGRVFQLLVIPPEWNAEAADTAMQAADSAVNIETGTAILSRYRPGSATAQ